MADMKRFKITNTTQKSPKYNSQGTDIRPIRDRVGHPVQFVIDGKKEQQVITIQAGRSAIVDDINEGVLKLFRKGLVRVETIKDISDELKEFTVKREQPATLDPATAEQPVSILEPEPVAEKKSLDVKASAAPMGETHDGERLINPDGDPNFLSRANKQVKKTKTSTWSTKED